MSEKSKSKSETDSEHDSQLIKIRLITFAVFRGSRGMDTVLPLLPICGL
ncbi:hypothetical protein [Methanosarcina horonobensis]|nr:hypothetical protein [Methanosarcina horonobensis]